ncbi:GNAT family N-acetyltransferase [Carboxylicivirga sp. M1479]|uniref:GNAT family N-acetyltransferase n=1 Tax=Carboxylicivirga sp. M1479 TaxID=2594476 RepID=UPI002107872E|nr:GNAT family protein [Carboxylicivirga sp. M1479]
MITSKRTFLRPVVLSDNEQMFCYRSDAVSNQYQSWIPKSLEEVNAFIAKNPATINEPNTWFQLAIVDQLSSNVIGDVGIHFIGDDGHQCEIGCTLSKEYHGRGLAFECMQVVINYLFHKLNKHRVMASIDPDNMRSIRLVERLGMRKEAHFKQSLYLNGKWVDDVIYAVLKSEWSK